MSSSPVAFSMSSPLPRILLAVFRCYCDPFGFRAVARAPMCWDSGEAPASAAATVRIPDGVHTTRPARFPRVLDEGGSTPPCTQSLVVPEPLHECLVVTVGEPQASEGEACRPADDLEIIAMVASAVVERAYTSITRARGSSTAAAASALARGGSKRRAPDTCSRRAASKCSFLLVPPPQAHPSFSAAAAQAPQRKEARAADPMSLPFVFVRM
jgi:hypothetical protein